MRQENRNATKETLDFFQIFKVIIDGKFTMLVSVLLTFLAVFIYNNMKDSLYEVVIRVEPNYSIDSKYKLIEPALIGVFSNVNAILSDMDMSMDSDNADTVREILTPEGQIKSFSSIFNDANTVSDYIKSDEYKELNIPQDSRFNIFTRDVSIDPSEKRLDLIVRGTHSDNLKSILLNYIKFAEVKASGKLHETLLELTDEIEYKAKISLDLWNVYSSNQAIIELGNVANAKNIAKKAGISEPLINFSSTETASLSSLGYNYLSLGEIELKDKIRLLEQGKFTAPILDKVKVGLTNIVTISTQDSRIVDIPSKVSQEREINGLSIKLTVILSVVIGLMIGIFILAVRNYFSAKNSVR